MDDAKFTILGMTSSGKTCYLYGMYFEMNAGMNGFTIVASDEDDDYDLQTAYDNMNDASKGAGRFPSVTDNAKEYSFELQCGYNTVLPFKWLDYPGDALKKKKEGNLEIYNQITQSIRDSDTLFLCVNGDLLTGDNIDQKIRAVRTKCSSTLNRYFSDYKKTNNRLPPIAIVVTKYDLCMDDTDKDTLLYIFQKSFSALFDSDDSTTRIVSIIPVSIGTNIESDSYQGELEPLNIHLPIFMGIWFALNNHILKYNKEADKIQNSIDALKSKKIQKKQERDNQFFIWRLLSNADEDDGYLDNELSSNYSKEKELHLLLSTMQKYERRILDELKKIELVFVNGKKKDSFEDAIEAYVRKLE